MNTYGLLGKTRAECLYFSEEDLRRATEIAAVLDPAVWSPRIRPHCTGVTMTPGVDSVEVVIRYVVRTFDEAGSVVDVSTETQHSFRASWAQFGRAFDLSEVSVPSEAGVPSD